MKAYELPEARETKKIYVRKRRRSMAREEKKRGNENANLCIAGNLSSTIHSALMGLHESKRTVELLGCSVENFKKYIETLFELGMSWDDYGLRTWELRNIKPCAAFDLKDLKQQERCFNHKNVKPVWTNEHWLTGGAT